MTVVVRNAVEICVWAAHSQHSKQRNTHCCLNGTMNAIPKLAFIPTIPLLAAKRRCIGSAAVALRDGCICTK